MPQIDRRFGKGNWRPLPRTIVEQDDKNRPIDNAKANDDNAQTIVEETIVCQSGDIPARIWKRVVRAVMARFPPGSPLPQWLIAAFGTEDMWKGYRQNHPTKDDERFCISTFIDPRVGERRYCRSRGLPFGFLSVVNQFNRFPHLFTAILRRILLVLAAHFFDDCAHLDLASLAAATKAMVVRLADLFNVIFNREKRRRMSSRNNFLGYAYDFSAFLASGSIVFGIKASTLQKAWTIVAKALGEKRLTPGDASKVRGILSWVDTGITGRPCRGAMCALTGRQYGRPPPGCALTPELEDALHFFLLVLTSVPARIIPIIHDELPPVVIYTDASARGPSLRLGVLVLEQGVRGECGSWDVPAEVVDTWELRSQYIGQAELLCGPLVLHTWRERLRGRSILWFVDNFAAVSAMAKTCSPTEDNSRMALIVGLLAAELGIGLWLEYVHTAQNPADWLSRLGLDDPQVARRLLSGEWTACGGDIDWSKLLNVGLRASSQIVAALGCAPPALGS